MKKTKILTILGVMLAMGLTACGGGANKESSKPAGESSQQQGGESSQQGGESSQQGGGSSQQGGGSSQQAAEKDQTGHIWGAEADVAGDAEAGTVAYKRAECTENDGAVKYAVNQSVFSYEKGGRKSGTPEGYTKLNANGDIMSVKINSPKYLVGKMYLYGCMDGWSSNSSKNAFAYNGKANIEIKVNDEALDIDALKNVVYTDFLSGSGSDYSDDGYGFVGDIVLVPGVNYITYKRVASMNTLVKDFVFVGKEFDSEWGEGQAVAAEDGYVGYTKYQSNFNAKRTKIEIRALDGSFAEGSSNKNGTEEGYMKLNSNGNKISWKFKSEKAAIGAVYQYGFMDSFSSNTQKTYAWISSSSSATSEEGNFRVSINDNIVDKSAYMDITFQDLTKEGEVLFEESKNYSPVALCPIGQLVLKAGDNTLTYERLGSYNFAVSKLVLVVDSADADFAVETTYSSNDDAHYYAVTGTDVVFNKEGHKWASDADLAAQDTASTCSVNGIAHEKCSVCGKTRERKLDLLPHTWVSDPDAAAQDTASTCTEHGQAHMKCSVCGAKEVQELPLGDHALTEGTAVQNSDSKNVTPLECSACHKVGAKMSIDDYSSAQFDKDSDKTPGAIRPSQGKAIVYKVIVSKAGTYVLNFGFLCKSNGGVAMSQRKLAVSVGETAQTMLIDESKTPDALGMNGTTPVQLDIAEVTLAEGENVISLVCASYRLHYSGILRVLEK